MDGLECSEVLYSFAKENKDCRIDSQFFTAKIKHNGNLEYCPIGKYLISSQYGVSKDMNTEGYGYPIFRMNEIHHSLCDLTTEKFVELSNEEFYAVKVIELPSPRFRLFSRALLADYDFIAENKNAIRHDEDARHCLLILDAEGKDGFLVDPQGYNYARYSAFVPNARSLLTPDMGIDRSYLSPTEPWRDESRDEMLRMTLRVDGKPDYTLVLPADEDYLDAVKNYLDIDVFADALLCDIRFKVPYIGELICDTDCPAVEDYNDFAEALEGIWQQDGALLTYAAVLEAERPDTLRGACELLRNLDNYQRIVEGAYGYGQQRLQETLGLDDEAIYELEGYMDFEKYGQDCMENDCVTKTEFGLLRRLDPPFQEQTQGQQMFQ